MILHFLFFAIGTLPAHPATAQSIPVNVIGVGSEVRMSGHFSVLEDTEKTLTIQQVSSPAFLSGFQPNPPGKENFGYTRSALWFRAVLVNNQATPTTAILFMPRPWTDSVELFQRSGAEFIHSKAGDSYPHGQWAVRHPNIVFRIPLKAEETAELYLRVHDEDNMELPFTLMSQESFDTFNLLIIGSITVFVSIALAMLAYNLLLFLSLMEVSYLIYVIYLLATSLMVLSLKGVLFMYLWPEAVFWANRTAHLFASLTQAAGVVFASHVFNTSATLPRFHRIIRLFIAYIFLYTPLIYIVGDFRVAGFITANVNPFLFNIMMGAIGVAAWRNGARTARFYLAAFAFSIIGISVFLFGVLGVAEYSLVTDNALGAGYLLEMIFLSLMLADKINLLRMEKDAAQTAALENERKLAETLLAAKEDLERKVAERTLELSASKDQAEQATMLKDKFVSLVSHDLRSPLGSILGLAKLVDLKKQDPIGLETNQGILKRIIHSAEALLELIDQLLDISRLKTGKIRPQTKFTNIHFLAAGVLANHGFLAERKGITLVNKLPEKSRIFADPNLLSEVLSNLVSNAIKFCSAGDTVTVMPHTGGSGSVTVKDTGPGIPPSFLPDLFKSEVKTTSPGSAGEKGTGLGLPYCQDIMAAHGGSIWVESAPGAGAAFHLRLPIVNCLILIVDDQEAHRAMMKKQLSSKMETAFLEAENGDQAAKMLRENAVHLIITDIRMPVMDGFELISVIRNQLALTHIPVIVATSGESSGESVQNLRKKVFDIGADDFVIKPVQPDDFIPRVARFIG